MFACLKWHQNTRMTLDHSYPEIDNEKTIMRDWTDFMDVYKKNFL